MKEQLKDPQVIREMPKLNPVLSLFPFICTAMYFWFSVGKIPVLKPKPLLGSGRLFCAQK